MTTRLEQFYKEEVVPKLMKQFGMGAQVDDGDGWQPGANAPRRYRSAALPHDPR